MPGKLAMVVFTVLSVVGFIAAVKMKERAIQLYISSGVLFSAGILIAGGFCHLLPDSNEQFEDLDIINFVWAFAITGLTVVCLACVEMAIHGIVGKIKDQQGQEENKQQQQLPEKEQAQAPQQVLTTADSSISVDVPKNQTTKTTTTTMSTKDDDEVQEQHVMVDPAEENSSRKNDAKLGDNQTTDIDPEMVLLDDRVDPWVAIILTVALSIHSIIEGIGIGATDDLQDFGSDFIAIAVHKFFTAYALANSLVCAGYWERGHRMGFYIQTGTFVGITLVGIGIGWAAADAASGNVASAILVGITAGSFIFVGAMEIAPTEMATMKGMKINPLLPIVCFLLGYCLMSLLAIWA